MRLLVCLLRWACLMAVSIAALEGCVAVVGGAALGSAIVYADRRSTGIQIEDSQIENRVNSALSERFARESVRIDVTSYDEEVLLAGMVPQEKDRADAEALAASRQNVRRVTNELAIGSLAGLSSQADDVLLSSKVHAALLEVKGLPPGIVKASTTLASVYLFGKVSAEEAELAKQATSRVSGVKRVVAAFEILTPEQYKQYAKSQ